MRCVGVGVIYELLLYTVCWLYTLYCYLILLCDVWYMCVVRLGVGVVCRWLVVVVLCLCCVLLIVVVWLTVVVCGVY